MRAVRLSAILLAIGVAGCAPDTPTESLRATDEMAAAHAPGDELGPEVHAWLAQLRGTLAPYRRFALAVDAGYDQDITGCMVEAGVGGMGSHYANLLLFDDTVEELAPEALLYEPQKNGSMRLVAVEYIVPFAAWPDTIPRRCYTGRLSRPTTASTSGRSTPGSGSTTRTGCSRAGTRASRAITRPPPWLTEGEHVCRSS